MKMCIALRLHKKVNSFTNGPPDELVEGQCSLVLCYINDKGLALNLGHPSSLEDSHIEIDLQDVPFSSPLVQRSISLYLDMANVQSSIVTFQALKAGLPPNKRANWVSNILQKLAELWGNIQKV
jgi:hypothetical protein